MSAADKPTIEDVRQAIHDVLQRYLDAKQQIGFPEPLPPTMAECVDWWIRTMQEPERWYERPHSVGVVGRQSASRWEYGYQIRLVQNLERFLRLSVKDRRMIVAGREDGVFWRGEPVAFFVQVVEETMRMREMGAREYAKAVAPGLQQLRQASNRRNPGEAA